MVGSICGTDVVHRWTTTIVVSSASRHPYDPLAAATTPISKASSCLDSRAVHTLAKLIGAQYQYQFVVQVLG
uniref:Uncharacterized protein n=1 Tax=Ascaris lumbricoides TaxID=6252 RepID=A0A0M3HUT8_ASCLU